MDAHQTPATSRPYDGPSQYTMSGGSGFPGPEPSVSRPWDRPSSYPDPISGPGPFSQDSTQFPSSSQPYDPSPKPYGPSPNPYEPSSRPYDPSTYPAPTGPIGPAIEQMPGPAAMSYSSQNDVTATAPLLPHQHSGLAAPMITSPQDIRTVKTQTQETLGELYVLQKKRQRLDAAAVSPELEQQFRMQAGKASYDLRTLREEVKILISDAERHRWRKWLIGGIVASIIPTVKFLFRRTSSEKSEDKTVTDTEHAFARSRALLSKIKDTVLGRNGIASVAFFVFAVLFVFSNEVTLMVAKTVNKRLKRLSSKLERGEGEIEEKDLKLLDGWRWRVLLLGQ